jgi:hypothetical protein
MLVFDTTRTYKSQYDPNDATYPFVRIENNQYRSDITTVLRFEREGVMYLQRFSEFVASPDGVDLNQILTMISKLHKEVYKFYIGGNVDSSTIIDPDQTKEITRLFGRKDKPVIEDEIMGYYDEADLV